MSQTIYRELFKNKVLKRRTLERKESSITSNRGYGQHKVDLALYNEKLLIGVSQQFLMEVAQINVLTEH
jgi:hypothetical protein